MTVHNFFHASLMGITFFTGTYVLLIWRSKSKSTEKMGLLFISLAMFSWMIPAVYDYLIPLKSQLNHLIKDRILSSFSNMFLLAALPYYKGAFEDFRKKIPSFNHNDKWIINILLFFVLQILIFSLVDWWEWNGVRIGEKVVVLLDSIISISVVFLTGYALYFSFKSRKMKIELLHLTNFVTFTMLITQISLSMYHFFPEILKPFYSLFLVMSLVSLTTFSIVLMLWASNDAFENEPKLQNEEAEKLNLPLQDGEDVTQASTSILSEIKIERNETTQQGNFTQIKSLFIGYDEHNFQYTLSLVLSNNEAKEEFTEIKQVGTRLLNPFIHWLLFSIAKKNGVLIAHVDIATTKFRMIEFLNKDSEIKINQEKIFINEGGFFGLTISDENITFDK